MYLDVVKREVPETERVHSNGAARKASEVFEPWADWLASPISHHGGACCEIVREWLANFDQSALNGGSIYAGPRWLRQRFDWGPSVYPVYWCEVLKKPKLDCGIHAALAYELFIQRGVKAFRTQVVQEFTHAAAASWHSAWTADAAITAWIDQDRIYHEACAIINSAGRLKLWDPSAGWWVDPKATAGYGSVLAIRISAREDQTFSWGNHEIPANTWSSIA